MSQNYSCDCKRKTCRHQVAATENKHITFSEPPSSPELPHLTEADIIQALAEAQQDLEKKAELEAQQDPDQEEMLEEDHGSPPLDSQPMIFDEDANDSWISDPEGLVK